MSDSLNLSSPKTETYTLFKAADSANSLRDSPFLTDAKNLEAERENAYAYKLGKDLAIQLVGIAENKEI